MKQKRDSDGSTADSNCQSISAEEAGDLPNAKRKRDSDGGNHENVQLNASAHGGDATACQEWFGNLARTHEQNTMELLAATNSGDIARIQDLLAKGADIQGSLDKVTPLHVASKCCRLAVVQLLIQNHANVNALDNRGNTPLHWVFSGSLFGQMYVTAQDLDCVEVAKLLIENGCDVHSKSSRGSTPLHYACSQYLYQEVEAVKLLLENGANVNVRDDFGATPWHIACAYRGYFLDLKRLLLEHGADVNAKDKYGETPLHAAYSAHDVEMVELLIEHGADVNARSKSGSTVLHSEFWRVPVELARLVIANGANVTSKDNSGETPLHNACLTDNTWREYETEEEMAEDCRETTFEVSKMFLEHGADVNAKDNFGETPLHKACQRGFVKVLQLLMSRGANVNALSNEGCTPLHVACNSDYAKWNNCPLEVSKTCGRQCDGH